MRAYDTLHSLLLACITDMGLALPDKLTIEPPKDERHGDLATNAALVLAKQAGRPPRELAQALADAIAARCAEVARVDVAGPGFLNVTFTPAFWQATVALALEAGQAYGHTDTGRGRRVQVEYVSANPTGPLHIGHGRGAAVGDSLARVLRAAGYDTQTEYYVNDAGRQMLILGQSVWYRMQALLGRDVPEPEDYYRGDYIKDIARELLAEKGRAFFEAAGHDEAVAACREKAMADILAGIRKDLEDFGVEHQVWFSERSLLERGAVDGAFEHLRARGLAFDQDGAFWFRSTEYGDDKDRVLRKSDGLLT
jgi:arginyl-tRNA synthetase